MTEAQAREIMKNYYTEDEEGNKYYFDIIGCERSASDYCILVCVLRGAPIPKNELDCPHFWVGEDGSVSAIPMRKND